MDIQKIRVGSRVRGVFLDDEPVLIDGTKNEQYGQAIPFTGLVRKIDSVSYGGPYVEVTDYHNIYLCDPEEILELLPN
jgi:hypothetical protein